MSTTIDLPSYEELFGELDFKEGDEARSVYSPAAYLADLLQLLDDRFENIELDQRRADIKNILLNAENTFTLAPYLDIVNEVLASKLGQSPYEKLKTSKYPFNLPFNLENERVKKYLSYLGVTPEQLYKHFALQTDPSVVAREYLGLSEEEYGIVTTALSQEAELKECYRVENLSSLQDVGLFLRTTGLSGRALRELLFQNLSDSVHPIPGVAAQDTILPSEKSQASRFFINYQLDENNGYVKLDQAEEKLIWSNGNGAIPPAWLDRVNRFVRLAHKIGLSFTDLDLILRSCCSNRLDDKAIRYIAVVKQLHDLYKLPVDVVCSFFGPMNTLGIGDKATPQDLFNRVFNVKFAAIDKKYIPGSDFIPQGYSEYESFNDSLTSPVDPLSLDAKEYRRRLSKALGMSDRDLAYIVTQFKEKYAVQTATTLFDKENIVGLLSLLYRISKLAEVLDISYTELFYLLDILEKDPSIRKYSNFNILIPTETQTQDCYKILAGGDIPASMWLVQILFAIVTWMQANDFTAEELNQILTGSYKSEAEQENARNQKIGILDNLYQQFKAVMLNWDLFVSDRFNDRSARVIQRVLVDSGDGLVCPQDQRLVRFDHDLAVNAAYEALNQMERIRTEDFMYLGLEQRMLDKIFDNLIIKGYLNTEGELIEGMLPQSPADFKLASDFSPYKEALFMLIRNVYSDEDIDEVTNAPGEALVEVSLFLTDLEALEELSEAERNELYDNLVFNGYIDDEGNVLQADFFALEENSADFEVNANLSAASTEVFNRIVNQIKQFEQAPLILDPDIFAELSLTQTEIDDLIENLKFNEYLDANNVIVNKSTLLSQNSEQFNLALAFYPQRRLILEALKQLIREFKADFYILDKEAFRDIADAAVAQQVVEGLEADYLSNNKIKPDIQPFFLDNENLELFLIGAHFTYSETAMVFDQIALILSDRQKYQLPLNLLDELEFEPDEMEELIEVLTDAGILTEQLMLPADKVAYFLNINNALDFSIEAFEDYNKDIFFGLHVTAKEMNAAIQEIVEKVKYQADLQESILFEVLQDALELPVDIVKVVCRHVFHGLDHVVEEFMLPVLAAVDTTDAVSKEPNNNKFNFAYKRILQFALLASKLRLSQEETEVVFHDQDLVEKFPEKLVFPENIERFDTLWQSPEGIIYLFKDGDYWAYSAENYNLLKAKEPISALSGQFVGLPRLSKIDAAFTDRNGTSFIIAGEQYFYKAKDSTRWVEKKDRSWGRVKSNFDDPERIDATFQDEEGKTYLFSGAQYVRYSGNDYRHVDEGYPLSIADHWKNEGLNAHLPDRFKEAIDASFQTADGKTYLFKDNKYICSEALSHEMEIKAKWGRVRNNFEQVERIDAAYSAGAEHYLFSGDQVIVYRDSLENDGVSVVEGYPQRIELHFVHLPAAFESNLEAAFKGADDQIHLFKDGKTVAFKPGDSSIRAVPIRQRWGIVTNKILDNNYGRVDAAFVGLDGKTYLFSDDQYIRYSGTDYSQVDEGYPRLIAADWGGLKKVDAAFVLDGKTYLFSKADPDNNKVVYVCYSTKDYSAPDIEYPKEPDDNWWNLPIKLVKEGAFVKIDSVFNGKDNRTYLFSGNQFISFDNKHRWWSEPQELRRYWDSIPFDSVDAAFAGKDGKTYIFSGNRYVRYSNSNYSKTDDRYPKTINTYWGNVVNNIAKTGKIDAALVVESREIIDEVEQPPKTHTYLFSGNQYFRYEGSNYGAVEYGYPKYIATSLKNEPRFKNLDVIFGNGLDAALADQRNIYLFKDSKCCVVSESLYKKYDNPDSTQVSCAFIEDGALMVEDADSWQRYTGLEGETVQKTPLMPRVLREAPDTFRNGLDAVLKGVDGNSYLFKGPNCFNILLGQEYPLKEEWGQLRNNIYINNTIDAAFVGRDNKTYLFSGCQFVTYCGHLYLGAKIEGHPRPIKDHWGGLTSVALAYVQDRKTYLFEKADEAGNFRYVCYSTADYTHPDAGFPQTATMEFWQIPATYHEEGFTEVTAVLFEGDNMLLLSRDRYIQFNNRTKQWSYPRLLNRFWHNFPDESAFPGVKTAFTGTDGATYFFSAEKYICYSENTAAHTTPTPAPIKDSWGLVNNNFFNNPKVDAAFVYQNKTTYLFSGDQYVRYSGQDYRYVDEGYPKTILNNLRQEEGFKNLPETFEDELAARDTGPMIDAVVANRRNIYLFSGGHWQVASQCLTASYDHGIIGRVINRIVDNNRVDAAFVNNQRQIFLFSGDQYVRYSDDNYDCVDDGYPKAIASFFKDEIGVSTIPDAFNYDLDAVLNGADGGIYIFKDKDYLNLKDAAPQATAIKGKWGLVKNSFITDPISKAIDAAFISPDGGLYLFKGNQYIRYQQTGQEFVDEGYPKSIKDNWGNLPVDFEEAIDGGFVFEEKTYLLKGDKYVRYSNIPYERIDSIYPQELRYRWGKWADYLLGDIKTITRFKQLQETYQAEGGDLAGFLNTQQDYTEAPYELLSALFGWDIDELKWLKRNNGFLGADNLFEKQFHLELIIRLFDLFALTAKMGAAPKDLFTNVWGNLYVLQQPDKAAEALYRFLALNHSEKEWPALANQIHGELNLLQRDALVSLVLAQNNGIENSRDLYEQLLIDVDMGSSGVTSRITEAIAATQLYFHRYLVNLEEVRVKDGQTAEEVRKDLKRWWKWLKNYRIWEANRKVFLYPENYIRPELRDTKTPAFKTLEEDLLQGEITAVAVQRAYKKYLDEYTEVSRLTIAGGYVYDDPQNSDKRDRSLVLFGQTKTNPKRYYYRLATFFGGEKVSTSWTPWLSVNIQIDADKVYPVFAFDRVFVFWAKTEAVVDSAKSTVLTTKKEGDKQIISSDTPPTHILRIYYSFYNLNKEWMPAQTLTNKEVKIIGEIESLKLFVENSNKLLSSEGNSGDHQNIIINCAYKVKDLETQQVAFSLTPELYTQDVDTGGFDNSSQALFHDIFDEPEFNETNMVMFNSMQKSADGPWFSFDHKGGSFLCRPAIPPLGAEVWLKLANNQDKLPAWNRIDAAFTSLDEKSYFFNNDTQKFVDSSALNKEQDTKDRWGKVRNNIAETGVVDAALVMGGKTYLFSGDEYLIYSSGLELADFGCPKKLSTNSDGLPKWVKVGAAFTGLDGKSYFFNNGTKKYVDDSALSSERDIKIGWGKMKALDISAITVAFTSGDYTYLVFRENDKDKYVRYRGAGYDAFEPGYPQSLTNLSAISELEVSTVTALDPTKVTNIFYHENYLYFQYQGETRFQKLEIKIDKPNNRDKFLKELDRPLKAAVFQNGRIYIFKKLAGEGDFYGINIYNVEREKWDYHRVRILDNENKLIRIDAALVGKDGQFYLLAGNKSMMKSGAWIDLIEKKDDDDLFIPWKSEPVSLKDWVHGTNNIIETGQVDAAFVRDTYTYLFSGDQYVRYTGDDYNFIDEGYPKLIKDNMENIPKWSQVGAAFHIKDGKTYFFDNTDKKYVESGRLGNKSSTKARWGRIRNNFTELGQVDAAYISNNHLYLISGDQFIRYELDSNGAPGNFVDGGYPKTLVQITFMLDGVGKIDAVFTYKDTVYLFCGDRYAKVTSPVELVSLTEFKYIQGNWGNLPSDLRAGFDAALNRGDQLYLFKGDQYIKFADNALPYEIWDVEYDIVRLTTSTAYKLNERLFSGGVPALLNLDTQEIDELPSFSEGMSTPTNIKVRPGKADQLPASAHLDFDGANGLYYWEVFFHAPFLIAQALNTGQKFAEAKEWYEYIFDPTEIANHWKFLPFQAAVDNIQAIMDTCNRCIQELKEDIKGRISRIKADIKKSSSTDPAILKERLANPERLEDDLDSMEADFRDPVFPTLERWLDVFQGVRQLSKKDEERLKTEFASLSEVLLRISGRLEQLSLNPPTEPGKMRRFHELITSLAEQIEKIGKLWRNYQLMGDRQAQINRYLDDPFDPHAIAALRTLAYRKTIVMGYIDNLLDWGDLLFRQYTRESIDEARMLYILAYDLLGEKPENLGTKVLSTAKKYNELVDDLDETDNEDRYDFLVYPQGTVHDSIANPYFFIPENSLFNDYWNRVEDRLYKIRQSLNIMGISQPLPLFEPPIDPMALVQAVSSGAALSSALASLNVPAPHYRFKFMLRKAQELAQKLSGFGSDLLSVLERKNAEELSLLQNRQEAEILSLMQRIKEAQLEEAEQNIISLEESLRNAKNRVKHYQDLIDKGLSQGERAQLGLMITAATLHQAAALVKTASAIAHAFPESKFGVFILGTEYGGRELGEVLEKSSEALETGGEAFSMTGEAVAITAAHERMVEEWTLQKDMAESNVREIRAQVEAAQWRKIIAEHEKSIVEKEIEHNRSIATFMKNKFTTAQLYQWLAGKLSGIYFQTYNMAYDMAKSAEKAFQFERGLKESEVNYIQPLYWDSQKNGLLAGESLGLDLDRMEKAYLDSDSRSFEITKNISLLELDPVALLQLKSKGVCEFSLTEALFDYDFQGHYRRQIKTLSLTFHTAEGQRLNLNATLTQLNHKTVLEADVKAVKYLLNPKDQPPPSLRSDWKANQQIALSYTDDYEKNNGLFELRFDDDRYLPFEGAGAVSTWRLELNGKRNGYGANDLLDVTINLKYTAAQGGSVFANAVKGLLKPYQTARFFDLAAEFPDEWEEFLSNGDQELVLTFTRDMFPNMSSSKIAGIFTHYELAEKGEVNLVLNDGHDLILQDGKYLPASGLSISSQGSDWVFTLEGDKAIVNNIGLVLSYKANAG